MPDDNTQIILKDEKDGNDEKAAPTGSRIFNVSVRAWIAIMFSATVCATYAHSAMFCAVVIEEPFKTLSIGAISFFFGHAVGQSKQSN